VSLSPLKIPTIWKASDFATTRGLCADFAAGAS
jgi:hypothetical protein